VTTPIARAAGLTLIELLVAVAIFGVLSVTAYAGLNRLLDQRAQLEHEREYWRDLSLMFVRLGDDLAHARDRPVRDQAGIDKLPALRGQPTDTRALGEPALEFTRGGELTYGTARRSDLRRVAWRLREGRLERLTWPVLDRGPVTARGLARSFAVVTAHNAGPDSEVPDLRGLDPHRVGLDADVGVLAHQHQRAVVLLLQ